MAVVNLTISQGATFRATGAINNANPDGSVGGPTDLTGATARMQIRSSYGSSAALYELNTTNGDITLGGTAGTISLVMPATATATLLPPGTKQAMTYVYDILVTLASGDLVRVFSGTVLVTPAVTQ